MAKKKASKPVPKEGSSGPGKVPLVPVKRDRDKSRDSGEKGSGRGSVRRVKKSSNT